jgi:hypothetical protein
MTRRDFNIRWRGRGDGLGAGRQATPEGGCEPGQGPPNYHHPESFRHGTANVVTAR